MELLEIVFIYAIPLRNLVDLCLSSSAPNLDFGCMLEPPQWPKFIDKILHNLECH